MKGHVKRLVLGLAVLACLAAVPLVAKAGYTWYDQCAKCYCYYINCYGCVDGSKGYTCCPYYVCYNTCNCTWTGHACCTVKNYSCRNQCYVCSPWGSDYGTCEVLKYCYSKYSVDYCGCAKLCCYGTYCYSKCYSGGCWSNCSSY